MAPKARLTEGELRYLTDVDGVDHFAIGAARRHLMSKDEGVGSARFVRIAEEPDTAEPAVTVIDSYQGKGLGSILLQRLIEAAWERSFEAHDGIAQPRSAVSRDRGWGAGRHHSRARARSHSNGARVFRWDARAEAAFVRCPRERERASQGDAATRAASSRHLNREHHGCASFYHAFRVGQRTDDPKRERFKREKWERERKRGARTATRDEVAICLDRVFAVLAPLLEHWLDARVTRELPTLENAMRPERDGRGADRSNHSPAKLVVFQQLADPLRLCEALRAFCTAGKNEDIESWNLE